MVLLSLASSLVFMNIGKSGRMKKNRMVAAEVMEFCKKARLRSVGMGIPACLRIFQEEGDSGKCWVDFNSVDGGKPDDWDGAEVRLTIPSTMRVEGEGIRSNENGVFSICFFPDGSSTGGRLTLSVEAEFSFDFRVDCLTGSILNLVTSVKKIKQRQDG